MKKVAIILLCYIVAITGEDNKVYVTKSEIRAIHNEILTLRNEFSAYQKELRTVNINDYLDNTMVNIQNWVIQNGLDPMEIPDVEKSLGIWPLRLKLILDHGWMQGLSSVQRGGDATVNYENLAFNIQLPLGFPTILVNYDYKIIYGIIPQTGGVEGKIKNLRLSINLTINTKTLMVTLEHFKIVDSGRISIKLSGHPLLDWITNLVISAATTILHGIAINIIENNVKDVIVQAIDQINEAIQPSDLIYLY